MNSWSGELMRGQVRQPIKGTLTTRTVVTNHAVVQLLYVVAAILVTLPLQIVTVLEYPVRPALLALVIIPPLVWHTMTVKSSSYLGSPFTGLLWLIRWLAIVVYLLAHLLHIDIQLRATIAFAISLASSLFYEVGYNLASRGRWQTFLRVHILIFSAMCLVLLPIFLYQIITTGYQAGVYLFGIYKVKPYLQTWPNYFSISAAIVMGLIAYFGHRNRRYFLLGGVVGPMLWLSEGRVGAITLAAILGVWLWWSKTRNRRLLVGLLIVALATVIGVSILKPLSATGRGGRTIERSFTWRSGAAQATLDAWWQQNPVLGVGFNSFSDLQLEFQFYNRLSPIGSTHNDYIDLLVRGGLLYSLAFWGWIVMVAYTGLQARFDDERTLASQTMGSIIIGLMVAALVQNPFKTPEILLIFWYCAGVIAGLRRSNHPARIKVQKPRRDMHQSDNLESHKLALPIL